MQHVHMSTGFLFVLVLFALGLLAIILAFIVSMRRGRASDALTSGPYRTPSNPGAGENVYPERHYASGRVSSTQYAAAAPVTMMHNGGGTDMLTGMLIGNALSNHGGGFGGGNTTIIHEAPSSYDSDPSDSGFSYDSGSSGGSSSDFGGGGGCD